MNGTLRRLVAGGMTTLAVFWAARPGVAGSLGDGALAPESPSRACATDGCAQLQVGCGSSKSFKSNNAIYRTHVADPQIADVVQFSPTDLTIVGLQSGSTTISIWSAAATEPVSMRVHVSTDASLSDSAVVPAGLPIALPPATVLAPGLPIGSETNYVQQVPAISIETSSPVMANVGKVVEQQILVKNVGSVAAEQVEVRGNVSIDAELISTEPKAEISNSTLVWRFAKIPAGAQHKIVVRVKPLVAGELSCQTKVSFKSSASVKVQVREPKLKLTCDGPTSAVVGSQVHVMLNIMNTGTAPAEAVRIRQVVPAVVQTGHPAPPVPLAIEVGTLQPGESRVVQTASQANQPGLVRVMLVAEAQDGVVARAEHTLKVTAPRLALMSHGPDFRYLNRKATYSIVVSNPGDAMATNVNVMIGIPEGMEFIDGSGDANYNPEKRTVSWVVGMLDAYQKREFSITVLPRAEGEHLQRAVAWADNNLLAKTEKLTRVEGTTSLVMEVIDVEDPIEIDSETTYQIHLVNRGSKAAERVQVAAAVPEGMKIMSVEGTGLYRIQGQQVIFEPIASLAPQSATVLQIRVKGTAAGTQRFRAVMSCPSMTNSIITEEATEVYGN